MVRVWAWGSRAVVVPRLPFPPPRSPIALWPQTTRSPTASWRSSTWSHSPPRRPRAARSSWQAVLSRSTSVRRAANTMTSWAGSCSACWVRGPPVLQQRQGGGRLGVGGHHPIMGLVGSHRLLHEPAPDEVEGVAFPRLVLPPVLGQFRGAEPEGEGADPPAGIDRGQLPIITDQHHLGLRLLCVLEEAG